MTKLEWKKGNMMKQLNYKVAYKTLLTTEIVAYLSRIQEQKGQQTLFIEAHKDALTSLLEIAKIQSTDASNRIEGIVTAEDRLKKLVLDKTTPKNRSEREIAGYRDVLNTIHNNYDYIPVRPGRILQLHRDLYRFESSGLGGQYKISDNVIAEELCDGTKRVRFQPVPAWETPEAMDKLCDALQDALADPDLNPILLIPMFILDFLCIHPFHDGNGRMSRLLTLLLLYRSGYIVGKYISIEKLIADTKESYYDALLESSQEWYEGKNDYLPFVQYFLGVVLAAYRDFSARVELLATKGLSKPDRVREVIRNTTGRITKAEIMAQCPDISAKTIDRALKELRDSGAVIKISGGRYTSYAWNWEKE